MGEKAVECKTLQEAKLAIMAQVPYVRKVKGEKLPYSYASEAAFVQKVRPVMVSHQVTCAPIACRIVDSMTLVTSKEKTMMLRCVESTYRFTHVPSGSFEDVCVIGEGGDSLDKSSPKAMTQAFKYAIRQWLFIETGDDPDKIQEVDAMHLSPSAMTARDAIQKAADKVGLDTVEKRIAASSNIGTAEKSWLIEALQAKRDELLSLDDIGDAEENEA